MAKQNRDNSVLKAPFAGIVKSTTSHRGSYVNVGDAVVTLVRTDPLRFRAVGVPERSSTRLQVGQSVRISIEGESTPVEATISRISPSLDLASRSLTIEADIKNSDGRFRTGLFAEAEIVIDPQQRALAVPESSIVHFAGVERYRSSGVTRPLGTRSNRTTARRPGRNPRRPETQRHNPRPRPARP